MQEPTHSFAPTDSHLDPVVAARAVERGREALWAAQRSDGGWDQACDAGVTSTAQAVVALHFVERLEPTLSRKVARYLASQQRPDGSFGRHPGAESSHFDATANAWAALSLLPEAAEARVRAERWVHAHGGLDEAVDRLRHGELNAIYLALAGLLPPARLPRLPLAWLLVPGLREILERRVLGGLLLGATSIGLVARGLCTNGNPPGDPITRRAVAAAIALHEAQQNRNGSFNCIIPATALALVGMRAAGLLPDDDRIARGATWLLGECEEAPDGGAWFPIFHSGLWTTALSVRALLAAGARADDPRMERAIRWLLEAQSPYPQYAGNQPDPRAVRVGGFAFEKDNELWADCDDTAVAIDAFSACLDRPELSPALRSEIRASIARAITWLSDMQNDDGGFPAFSRGLPGKPAGAILTRPFEIPKDPLGILDFLRRPSYGLGDPSSEDLTSRVIHALASQGFDRNHPRIERAARFIAAQRAPQGGWWGRWSANFLWATGHVILGLCAAGFGAEDPSVASGLRFLRVHQNADGGFGEDVLSYMEPELAGRGPSMAPVTGIALMALCAAGQGRSEAAARAAKYLVATQREDGTWPLGGHLQVVTPPDQFYAYAASALFNPILALSMYREARS
jgi:squalene-hopene/tetraprenyl-beta-curcumene cyclase